jgi:hypothetical protein
MVKVKAKQLLFLTIVSTTSLFQHERITCRVQTQIRRETSQKNIMLREDFETEFGYREQWFLLLPASSI